MDKDKRKQIATQIANDPNMLAFLEEMFMPEYSPLHKDVEKNIIALDDEQYGKAMKLFYLKREENRLAMDEIERLGQRPGTRANTRSEANDLRSKGDERL